MLLRQFASALVFLLAALMITLGGVVTFFSILKNDLLEIALLLVCVGAVSSLLAFMLTRPPLLQYIGGVRGQLLASGLVTQLLLLGMILVGARIMFFDAHDEALLVTMLLFAALLALGFSLSWVVPFAQRLERVREGTQELSNGNLDAVIRVEGNDEIAHLAADFNRMAAALKQAAAHARELEQARWDLIAAVSHDLRTPLAAMRAMIEALVDGLVDDPSTKARYLQAVQHEIAHVSGLVEDLFEIAQLDAGLLRLNLERASLYDLLSDTLATFGPQAQRQGVRLLGDVQGAIDPVLINPPKLQRVLYNLLDNALHHTPRDGTIVVRAAPCGSLVQVEVSDTGEGIAPEDLLHVFERSFRGEKSRTRRGLEGAPGAGLGLAIARGLIEAHGGTISVQSEPNRGASFRFTLQRAM
jgi:signal transduction histidine kinase